MLPVEFVQRMKSRLGDQYALFENALTQASPVSVRLNPRKQGSAITGQPVGWAEMGRYLNERPLFTLDPALHAGGYYVQEASSMFIEQAIRQHVPQTPVTALDLCAAPGGKSSHLVSLLHPDSLLVSNEVIRSRASILAENIAKWGYPNVVVTQNDPAEVGGLLGLFDVVVVDAPCSGEGLFRKDAEAASEWSEANVALCALRQRRILADVWPALKAEGLLIYCTCTYSDEENEQVLKWLREEKEVEFCRIELGAAPGVDEVLVDGARGYRFYPHRVKGEGFFLSVMRKTSTQEKVYVRTRKSETIAPARIRSQIANWMHNPEQLAINQLQDLLIAVPAGWSTEVEQIINHLHVVTRGTALATLKHEKLIPEHAWALSTELNQDAFEVIELDETAALAYLRKDALHVESPTRGFALVTYRQLPLGWINRLGNRTNNLYPANWRIRMK